MRSDTSEAVDQPKAMTNALTIDRSAGLASLDAATGDAWPEPPHVAPGIVFLERLRGGKPLSPVVYQGIALSTSFIAYTTYHLARKAPSIVKGPLHSGSLPDGLNDGSGGWAPFTGENGKSRLGELDLAFLLSYSVGMLVMGHIADRHDLRKFLTLGMLATTVFTVLFGCGYFWNIHSFLFFVVMQVMAGLGQSTGWPVVVPAASNWCPKRARGLYMAVWNINTSLGNILGSLVAAALLHAGWGWSIVVPGLTVLGASIIVWLFMLPSPEVVGLPSMQLEVETDAAPGSLSRVVRRGKRKGYQRLGDDISEGSEMGELVDGAHGSNRGMAVASGPLGEEGSLPGAAKGGDSEDVKSSGVGGSSSNRCIGGILRSAAKPGPGYSRLPPSDGEIAIPSAGAVASSTTGGSSHGGSKHGTVVNGGSGQEGGGTRAAGVASVSITSKSPKTGQKEGVAPGGGTHIGFWEACCIPGIFEFALCLFFSKLVAYTFMYWLPYFVRQRSVGGQYLSNKDAGYLSSLFDIGAVLGGLVSGAVSDRTRMRAGTIAAMLLLSIPALHAFFAFGGLSMAANSALMLLAGVLVIGPYGLITTAVCADLGNHESLRGDARALSTVTAIIDGIGSLGGAVGPLITGYLADSDSGNPWLRVFVMMYASLLIAALMLARAVKHELAARAARIKALAEAREEEEFPDTRDDWDGDDAVAVVSKQEIKIDAVARQPHANRGADSAVVELSSHAP